MGQKVNPNSFRLIINNKFSSNWLPTPENSYKTFLTEDLKIRKTIKNFIGSYFVVGAVSISRENQDVTKIYVQVVEPTLSNFEPIFKQLFEEKSLHIESLNKDSARNRMISSHLKYLITHEKVETSTEFTKYFLKGQILLLKNSLNDISSRKYFLSISFLVPDLVNLPFLLNEVKNCLTEEVPYTQIFSHFTSLYKDSGIKGFKLQLSGCLSKTGRAETKWILIGHISTSNMSSNLDYLSEPVQTGKGIVGVKIWLEL
jgi:ABC-type cobalt transport system substrate-binding protein